MIESSLLRYFESLARYVEHRIGGASSPGSWCDGSPEIDRWIVRAGECGIPAGPFSDRWFVFCNRQKDKLKILRQDHNGFWLYYRRLERGRFQWPEHGGKSLVVTRRQLQWLLDGLTIEQRQAHGAVRAIVVI